MNSQTRATLLERLRDGADPVAWNEFFQRYGRLVRVYAKRRGCSDHTAEEIVQDVMLRVFQQRDVFQYDPHRGRFRDWLGTVVRNQVAEYRRRPSERVRAGGGPLPHQPAEVQSDDGLPDAIWEAAFEESLMAVLLDVLRGEMNPRDYLAFELLTLGGRPGAEVSTMTGLTRNAAYKARKRALARLRELGRSYREDGQLSDDIHRSLSSLPGASVARSLAARIEGTMRRRQEQPDHG
ncbi:MAG: sigma-70 family RNA polymerase sigma factor [Rhodopirellula sp.]|nr:sigma-70 family RNA polymerase sigma factor [Rhodopirellula sp.]